MSLSWCSSWPKLSLHYTEINNIMYAVKTLSIHVVTDVSFLDSTALSAREGTSAGIIRRSLSSCCIAGQLPTHAAFRRPLIPALFDSCLQSLRLETKGRSPECICRPIDFGSAGSDVVCSLLEMCINNCSPV